MRGHSKIDWDTKLKGRVGNVAAIKSFDGSSTTPSVGTLRPSAPAIPLLPALGTDNFTLNKYINHYTLERREHGLVCKHQTHSSNTRCPFPPPRTFASTVAFPADTHLHEDASTSSTRRLLCIFVRGFQDCRVATALRKVGKAAQQRLSTRATCIRKRHKHNEPDTDANIGIGAERGLAIAMARICQS